MEVVSSGLAAFLATFGLLAIFVVMLLKEAGVPVPIPSDLIMISAGVQAAAGDLRLLDLTAAVLVAVFLGGTIQFLIVRGVGRQFAYRFGRLVGLTPARLDSAIARLQGGGPLAVFIGLNVPGARAGVVVAAGLAGWAYAPFVPAMVAGGAVFYGWHVALGYLAGPSATAILQQVRLPLLPALLGLAALGLVVWLLLRGRRPHPAPESGVLDRLHSWTEAACPACLAATALQRGLTRTNREAA